MINQINISHENHLKILSIFPFLPSYPWSDKWEVDFYIDGTTAQIFREYSVSDMIANSYKEEIIYREKINYKNAKRIICRSNWAVDLF